MYGSKNTSAGGTITGPDARPARTVAGWLIFAGAFLALSTPLLLTHGGAYAWDQDNYHVPAILQIREHWPHLDLHKDVLSAVAPGYHWFIAGVSLAIGTELAALRLLNLAVSFLVLAALYALLRRDLPPIDSAIVVLPLATSNFFVKSSAWVVTDNAGLLLATVVLIAAVGRQPRSSLAWMGVGAAAAVFVRQTNAWLIGPLLLRWLHGLGGKSTARDLARHLGGLAAVSCPLLVVAWLHASWGGLVPAKWQSAASDVSLAGLAYMTVVFLVFAAFIVGPARLRREVLEWDRAVLLAAVGVGVLVATASPTTFNHEEGRWGGYFWVAVERLPSSWDRSWFFLAFSPLGMLAILGVWRMVRSTSGPGVANIWGAGLACWAATFLLNRQVFHRYFETMILVFLIVALALSSAGALDRGQRYRIVLLASIQAAVTLATAWARSF